MTFLKIGHERCRFNGQLQIESLRQKKYLFLPFEAIYKLPKGSTILDFAFNIHSGLGSKCVGAIVNGKNVPIKYQLNNGDQVEVLTSHPETRNKTG